MNDNWCALCISILKEVTPEMAFELLENPGTQEGKPMRYKKNRTITNDDVADMVKLKETHSYSEIGEMYGMSIGAVYSRIKYYKQKHDKPLN